MTRFLVTVLFYFGVPLFALALVYALTDPYKTLRPFSLEYFDDINRDYLSSELYLLNYPEYRYDSFIFGSSRCGGINSYQWLQYLPEGSSQFVFNAWGETITGIEQKISYIDRIGEKINNALVVIDIPDTFSDVQEPDTALGIKDPKFSGQSRIAFQSVLFWDFIQKPSQWIRAVRNNTGRCKPIVGFDPVSNDWEGKNRTSRLECAPSKDSLRNCSPILRESFIKENGSKTDADAQVSESLINDGFVEQLEHIHAVFVKQNTRYKIVVSPAYYLAHPKISAEDFAVLKDIFGEDNVYDFSGKNYLTSDYNNFSDPNHFGLYVGWHMIDDIYGNRLCFSTP